MNRTSAVPLTQLFKFLFIFFKYLVSRLFFFGYIKIIYIFFFFSGSTPLDDAKKRGATLAVELLERLLKESRIRDVGNEDGK